MDWESVGEQITKSAPVTGSILSGGGVAAESVATLLASSFGCEVTPEAVSHAIKEDQKHAHKLKELESKNIMALLQWKTEQIRAESTPVALTDDGGDRWRLFLLSLFLFVVAFGLEGALLFCGFAEGISGELVGRVMGTVDTMAVMILSFWFGASRTGQHTESLLFNSTPAVKGLK